MIVVTRCRPHIHQQRWTTGHRQGTGRQDSPFDALGTLPGEHALHRQRCPAVLLKVHRNRVDEVLHVLWVRQSGELLCVVFREAQLHASCDPSLHVTP